MKKSQTIAGFLLLVSLPSAEALSQPYTLILVGGGIAALLLAIFTFWFMMRRKKKIKAKQRSKSEATAALRMPKTTLVIPTVVITLAESPQPERPERQLPDIRVTMVRNPASVPPQTGFACVKQDSSSILESNSATISSSHENTLPSHSSLDVKTEDLDANSSHM